MVAFYAVFNLTRGEKVSGCWKSSVYDIPIYDIAERFSWTLDHDYITTGTMNSYGNEYFWMERSWIISTSADYEKEDESDEIIYDRPKNYEYDECRYIEYEDK